MIRPSCGHCDAPNPSDGCHYLNVGSIGLERNTDGGKK